MFFEIELTKDYYVGKPTEKDIKQMKYELKEVNQDSFSYFIQEGYCYTSVMKDDHRSKDNFIQTNIITFDIDSCSVDMDETLKRLSIKPYICYTSPSNGLEGKGYRYRMIYCLEEPITKREDYYVYARSLSEQLGLQSIVGTYYNEKKRKEESCIDERSYYSEQYWNGCRGCNIFLNHSNNNILSYNDILLNNDFYKEYYNKNKTSSSKVHKSITQTYIKTSQHIGLSDTFEDDFWNLSYTEFLNKYDYPNIEHTPIEYDDTMPMITYPENYYEIRRPSYKTKGGQTKKIKDGEERRKKLYLNGIVRRKINPDISFDNLLYNLVYEFYYYYINDGNKIDKKILYQIAQNVMKADIREGDLGKPIKKSFANPLYCQKHNLTKREVSDLSKNKKQYIGEFYDFSKTDQENIEIMKEYGLVITIPTLKRWRKENGIKKYKKKV